MLSKTTCFRRTTVSIAHQLSPLNIWQWYYICTDSSLTLLQWQVQCVSLNWLISWTFSLSAVCISQNCHELLAWIRTRTSTTAELCWRIQQPLDWLDIMTCVQDIVYERRSGVEILGWRFISRCLLLNSRHDSHSVVYLFNCRYSCNAHALQAILYCLCYAFSIMTVAAVVTNHSFISTYTQYTRRQMFSFWRSHVICYDREKSDLPTLLHIGYRCHIVQLCTSIECICFYLLCLNTQSPLMGDLINSARGHM